ncbi:MAG: lysophospholipid acyltransferase family protein, partial [Gammaproteobacteria bacterium]
CLMVCPFLPFEHRFFLITRWSSFMIHWAKWCCGISFTIEGSENIPDKPVVVVAKHQSTWETFLFQSMFAPTATVLKQELIKVPFFGWALRLLDPIIIDRSQRKKALQQIQDQGAKQLSKNRWIIIYPEGTRIPVGTHSRLAQGAFILAKSAGVPVLPIVHNAGEYWNPKKLLKYPGNITVRIGKPIQTDSIRQTMEACSTWMTHNMHAISAIESAKNTQISTKKEPRQK